MVTIVVRDLVSGADTVDEGRKVGVALEAALKVDDLVSLSFSRIKSASSSFVTASLIPSVHALGITQFKKRVKISNVSWQIADIVRRRLDYELRTTI